MPNPVTYSPQALTNALNKGYFYIGTNDVGKGPTSSTGYFDGVTPSNSQYVIYYYKNGSTKVYYCNNGDQVYTITNRLKSQNFTTLESALNYIATQGDMMCVNRQYEPIVTDGLVFNLDAGFVPSYPMTNTTWYDLSDNDNDGVLTNGPTYSSDGGGSIVFDGTNDEVIMSTNSIYNTPSVTIESWVNLISDGSRHIILANWTGYALEVNPGSDVVMYVFNTQGQVGSNTPQGIFQFNTWCYIAGVYDNSLQEIRTYINGVLRSTRTNTPSITYSVSNRRISPTLYGGGPVNNKISIVRQYDRVLSNSEILQNYNAQKGRFGL